MLIENYRGLRNLSVDLDDYTALIGPNGAGKSSVLYALAWFFDGGALAEEDLYRGPLPEGEQLPDSISVTVTFADLTLRDRRVLEKYGRRDVAVFRREWSAQERKSKIIGNALQGPGFSALRAETSVVAQRARYAELRVQFPDLPELAGKPGKGDIEAALLAWEADRSHANEMQAIQGVDATNLFGAVGTSVIGQLVRLVLVPASIDMTSQLGTTDKKAALSDLVGALVAAASERVHGQWLAKHSAAVDELQTTVHDGVTASTHAQAERINDLFGQLVPGAAVRLSPNVAPVSPRIDVKVLAEVEIDGQVTDISRHGHGVQRAVMLTTLRAMVSDELPDHSAGGGESGDDVTGRPHLIVCIEEPEIYQHPLRARNFARVLTQLARDPQTQVLVATHSPYFVRPEQFGALRRFCRDGRVVRATVETIAANSGLDKAMLDKNVGKLLPTSFSDAFFSDAAVLVEGDTDRATVEALCELLGAPLDLHNIAIVDVGSKLSFRTAYEVLTGMGIDAYVIADGDRGEDSEGSKDYNTHRTQTSNLLAWLPGGESAAFGAPSFVGESFTCWHTDLEQELKAWPSLTSALSDAGGRLGKKYASHYRSAVLAASDEDMPESLRMLAARLHALGARGASADGVRSTSSAAMRTSGEAMPTL